MTTALDALLSDSIKGYDRLLQLLDKKKDVLIKGDTDKLQELTQQEQELIGVLQQTDENLIQYLGKKTLIEVIEEMDMTAKETMLPLYTSLIELTGQVKKKNAVNKALLEDSLTFTKFIREQMIEQSTFNYGSPNQKGKGTYPNQGSFDTKA